MQQHVLVVDDEAEIRDVLDYNLRAAGFAVDHADSGMVAVARAQSLLPDAIVLDVNLPGLDGLAVCEILRLLPSTRHIPILMLTALSSGATRKLGRQLGADAFMTKPFSPRELVAQVAKLAQARAIAPEAAE